MFDLIILGGGPGGYPLALKMATEGWKVAIVDKALEYGGTCLNWGCIPTKSLLSSAHTYHNIKNPQTFGLSCLEPQFSWQLIQKRKNDIVEKLRKGIMHLLEKTGVTVYDSFGKLNDANLVTLDNKQEIKARKICIATGSVPFVPGALDLKSDLLWTSNNALNALEIPETMLIIGGGVIGLEMGQIFSEFGCKVTIVEMMPQILPGLESAVAKRLLPVFKKKGIKILTAKTVDSLKEHNGCLTADISGSEYEFSRVLVATGRRPNLSFLSEETEIEVENGCVKVDENYKTSIDNVFAIGDVIAGPMLAHKATYDATILSEKFKGKTVKADYSMIPSCVYTYPEIAWIGKNEDELKEQGISYVTGRSLFSANGKALTSSESEGQIKTLFSESGKLLGASIWGPQASNIINYAAIMGAFNIPSFDLQEAIFPHPTLSEAYLESVMSAAGQAFHS